MTLWSILIQLIKLFKTVFIRDKLGLLSTLDIRLITSSFDSTLLKTAHVSVLHYLHSGGEIRKNKIANGRKLGSICICGKCLIVQLWYIIKINWQNIAGLKKISNKINYKEKKSFAGFIFYVHLKTSMDESCIRDSHFSRILGRGGKGLNSGGEFMHEYIRIIIFILQL